MIFFLTNRFSADLNAAMLKPKQELQVDQVNANREKEFLYRVPRILAGQSFSITIAYAVDPVKQLQSSKSLFTITSLAGTNISKEIELDLR